MNSSFAPNATQTEEVKLLRARISTLRQNLERRINDLEADVQIVIASVDEVRGALSESASLSESYVRAIESLQKKNVPWTCSWAELQRTGYPNSKSEWAYRVEQWGKRDGAPQSVIDEAEEFTKKDKAEKAAKHKAERDAIEKLVDPETHPKKWTKVSKEHVQSLHDTEIDDDGFLYHVTPRGRAGVIAKAGVQAGHQQSMGQGSYSEYSKDKAFVTDRKGVRYWQGKIGDHLEYQGRPRATDVLRIPKHAVDLDDLEDDELGTRDAYAKAYYSKKPIAPKKK